MTHGNDASAPGRLPASYLTPGMPSFTDFLASHNPALLPVFVHLGLVLMLGLWIPPYLAEWYRQAAKLIG